MVAIVSGNALGLNLGSRAVLGERGAVGDAGLGSAAEQVYVNAATGNLVVQAQDEVLMARGPDAVALRTYNSQGLMNDDNGDNWATGFWAVPLQLTGVLNAVGSTIKRTDRDGSVAVYAYSQTLQAYATTEGDGAHDTITYLSAANQLEWRDGSTPAVQRYEASGNFRLLCTKDTSDNTVSYAYDAGGRISSATSSSGGAVYYDYSGANLQQVRTVSEGVTTIRVRYGYDSVTNPGTGLPQARLTSVTVDLSPADGVTADGNLLRTTYAYVGSTTRVATITQSDGTALAIGYTADFRVASITNGLGQVTTFTYAPVAGAGGTTVVRNAVGQATSFEYDAQGQLKRIVAPAVAGISPVRSFAYDASGNVLEVRDGEGRATVFEYDGQGNQTKGRDAFGNTVTRVFDGSNQVVTETRYAVPDPDGAGVAEPGAPLTTRYVYQANGRNLPGFEISAEGRVTEHRYSSFGERTSTLVYSGGVYSGVGSEADLKTWAAAQLTSTIERTDFTFDARGQLVSRTRFARLDAAGAGIVDGTESRETFIYDSAGRLLKQVSATGKATLYAYDGLGRVLAETNALGEVTSFSYGTTSLLKTRTEASGLTTSTVFDQAGNVAWVQQLATGATTATTRYSYDAAGRLRMTQDATGVRTWSLYDEAGRKAADVDGDGTMTEYQYDAADLLVASVTYATAVSTSLLVDAAGVAILTATVSGLRPATTLADIREWRGYDAAQRLVRVARTTGTGNTAAVTETMYDGASRITGTVQYANLLDAALVGPAAVPRPGANTAQDRITRNFYDADGLLRGAVDAENYLTTFAYNAGGRMVERVAYATAVAATGTLAQLTPASVGAADARTVLLYDAKGQLTGEVDAENYLTEHSYDGAGNRVQTIRYGAQLVNAASPSARVESVRPTAAGVNRVTTRGYDSLNRIERETNHEGTVTQYVYDNAGRLVSTTAAATSTEARSTLARYDGRGFLVAELGAEGAAKLVTGQTQAQVDAVWSQYATTHAYDAAGRRISSKDALNQRSFFYYNADGLRTHTVNALGEVKEDRYDTLGRLVEQVTYLGRLNPSTLVGGLVNASFLASVAGIASPLEDTRVSFTYTRDGKVASNTDALGNANTYVYNAFGDEISRTEATGTGTLTRTQGIDRRGLTTSAISDAAAANVITSATYDAFGRQLSATDGNRNVRGQSYDRIGRMVTVSDGIGSQRKSSYDAFGRVLEQWNPATPSIKTVYAYDDVKRQLIVTTPEGIQTTTVSTRHGQVLTVDNGQARVTYTYDRNGNLLETRNRVSANAEIATKSSYDVAGQPTETTDAAGNKVKYTYDAAGRMLTRQLDPDGRNLVTLYKYDGKGQRVEVTDANGVLTTIAYDRKGQVLKEVVDPGGRAIQTVYTYDARGKTLSVLSRGTTTVYAYDALGRRIQEQVNATWTTPTKKWTYDKAGNAASSTDGLGNLTRYFYDAADRLRFTVDPLGGVRENTYDPVTGRLVLTAAYTTPLAPGAVGATATFASVKTLADALPKGGQAEHRLYDNDGRLTATVDGTGAVVRYGYDANGNVTSRIAYATALTGWTPGSVLAPAADDARDEVTYTIYDANNRARYTVDGMGGVVERIYDGNGNVVSRTKYASTIPRATAKTEAGIAGAVSLGSNDPANVVERWVYDAAGRLAWSVDGVGVVTKRDYDANGNVIRIRTHANTISLTASPTEVLTSASDRITSFAYSRGNQLVIEVDALGVVTEYGYLAASLRTRKTVYANRIASVPELGVAGSLASIQSMLVKDATADRNEFYGYDLAGRLVVTYDGNSVPTETQYDAAGNAVATVRYGSAFSPNMAEGGVLSRTGARLFSTSLANAAVDRSTQRVFDAAGRLIWEVDPDNRATKFEYDGAGRLKKTRVYSTRAALPAFVSRYSYTATSESTVVNAVTASADDRVEEFNYDAAGHLLSVIDALGQAESFTYDALGRKLTWTDKAGSVWNYAYDAAGRRTEEKSPTVTLESSVLAAQNTVAAAASASAAVITQFRYDAFGNLTERIEAVGRPEARTTGYAYDAAGHQVRVIFPSVAVYNAAADAPASNGGTSLAPRVESQAVLETRTFYDAFGNAVANRDVGGAVSQKVYDKAGRVLYDVDALGFVTGYTRNAFGEVTCLARYGNPTGLTGAGMTQASQAVTKAQVEVVVAPGSARQLTTTYDRAGRATKVVEPQAYVSELDAAGNRVSGMAGKTTTKTYNVFGDVIQEKVLRNAADSWATTTRYYDKVGRETASVDAGGYLTRRNFDTSGNVLSVVEHANVLAPGTWSTASYTESARCDDDRLFQYTYDRLNRKTSEMRLNVAFTDPTTSVVSRGNLITSLVYDPVGNQTAVVDADGYTSYSYYDKLGRLEATVAPPRATGVAGPTLSPLTQYRRDAFGNVVRRIEYAKGAAGITASPAGADAEDRITSTTFDVLGRAVETTDAAGKKEFFSYDAWGHVAKSWRGLTGADGNFAGTSFQVNVYDKLGQVVETRTPASNARFNGNSVLTLTQETAGLVTTTKTYNGFGELTTSQTTDGKLEYFDYDEAGRIWRTNSGDGADRIQLFDLQGNVTAEIRSAGAKPGETGPGLDIATAFSSPNAADMSAGTRRVDTQYDALGRVTATFQAAREDSLGGVGARRQFVSATAYTTSLQAASFNGPITGPTLRSSVTLNWSTLAGLGSGDIKVALDYVTPRTEQTTYGADINTVLTTYGGNLPRHFESSIQDGATWSGGIALSWDDTEGVGAVTHVKVWKKDAYGNWQKVIDQAPGVGGSEILAAAPADGSASLVLLVRSSGTTNSGVWQPVPLTFFGDGYRYDASSLEVGNYEYYTQLWVPGQPMRVTASGALGVWPTPLAVIATPPNYGSPLDPALGWQVPPPGTTQVFNYRLAGSANGWSSLDVITPAVGIYSRVDTGAIPPGSYEFELLWYSAAQATPSHAIGTFTITPPVAPAYVAAVNYPEIGGIRVESGYAADNTQVPILTWDHTGVSWAAYRVPGGTWIGLAIRNEAVPTDVFGFGMKQSILLNVLPAGAYEIGLQVGIPPLAVGIAAVTIPSATQGTWVQVLEQSWVMQPIVVGYETRYEWRAYEPPLWVDEPWTFMGVEDGVAVWSGGPHYEYYHSVAVGQQPVYMTDQYGAIMYTGVLTSQWVWRWVPPTMGMPTAVVITPKYVPAGMSAAIPRKYSVTVNTPTGIGAVSASDNQIGQATWLNGGSWSTRPTVSQKLDRWGNVVEITDPRSPYWKTTYQYNANNQMVRQVQPDAAGNTSADSPVTEVFFDKLGRQVATKDANGNVNRQLFNAGGKLIEERHADGGIVNHSFNVFGDEVATTDAMGYRVDLVYDKLGRLTTRNRGTARSYTVGSNLAVGSAQVGELKDTWTYDELGRKLSQANGNGETMRYAYDLRGNLVETQQPGQQKLRASYDSLGRKLAEVDANGIAQTWTYDYFGRLVKHADLGGHIFTYEYDSARQLVKQVNTLGQNIAYSYDSAGQLTKIHDAALQKVSTYSYDLGGRRVSERTTQYARVYQDNHLAYDARGLLRDVADGRVHMRFDYDKAGNRTELLTMVGYQGIGGEQRYGRYRFFRYDSMNRQIVVDGVDAAGNLGTEGHAIEYDRNGNRTSDTSWSTHKVQISGGAAIAGFNADDVATYSAPPSSYVAAEGWSREDYRYDRQGRLTSVVRDGTQIDVRLYDRADRVVQSGPGTALSQAYVDVLNQNVAPGAMNGSEVRRSIYDGNGRILHQRTLKSDLVTVKSDVSWQAGWSLSNGITTYNPGGYDAVGNSTGYVVRNQEAGTLTQYASSLAYFDGYQAASTWGVGKGQTPGTLTQVYDVNGSLQSISDSTKEVNNRIFVTDAGGRVLHVNQAGNVQRQLIVNGEVMGIHGVGVSPTSTTSNPSFANLADFDVSYTPISASYPTASPGSYMTRTGDTLQTIAQAAYGDSSLWYRIAEANGLRSSNDMKVGQTLNIPNRVSTISNNATTFKPYDPSRIEGDKTPNLPMAAGEKGGGCGGVGKLLMVIVAVVATIFTAGLLAPVTASVAGASTGLAGIFSAGLTALAAPASLGFVTGMAMGAAASVASQLVGMATGDVKKFSWKGVALSALGSGIGAELGAAGGLLEGKSAGMAVARAVVGNVATQGIAAAVGLQKKFDWRGVAAAGVRAAVGQAVLTALGDAPFGGGEFGAFAARALSGLVAGAAAGAVKGGRAVVQQAAVDAFGNALGSSLAGGSSSTPTAQAGDPLGYFIAENDNWAHVDVQPFAQQQQQHDALYGWSMGNDGLGFRPAPGVGTIGMRYQGLRSPMFDDARVFSDSVDPNAMVSLGQDGRPTAFMPVQVLGGVTGGGAAAAGGYEVVRPRGAGGAPGYDLVRDMPSGAPASLPASPSLGLGAPPQPTTDKPWFDRAIEGMPIGVKAAAGLVQLITTKVGETLGTAPPSDSSDPGVRAYPDGSIRTPDGKFASAAGMPPPGTVNASNYAEFLKKNGVDVVGTELEVAGPLGVRKYDIGTRNPDGTVFGIEIKSGGATKSWYQEITDMYVNRFGAAGRGRIEGQRVTGSMTIYLPPGGH